VLEHLSVAIGWYRHLAVMDPGAGSAGDDLYLQNARTLGLQVLESAFQSAREEAVLISQQPEAPSPGEAPDQRGQRVGKAASNAAARVAQSQARIDDLDKRIARARGKTLKTLKDERDAVAAELDLEKLVRDNISKIAGFLNVNENAGLEGRISALRASVPELASADKADKKETKAQAQKSQKPAQTFGSGLIGQTSLLFAEMGDVRSIDALLSETARLKATVGQIQAPLRESMRALLRQGRGAINQPVTGVRATDTRKMIETITAQFKQVGNTVLPLRQEAILLDQVRANLLEWRKSVEKEYRLVLRSLITRVVVILAVLALVMLLSEVWRRATYRYVREVRRRRQVLLLRRFVTGFSMALVIALGFISEFGSLATFAGFLTAGIAVALQTVILSVAAYFFLIGRYGVRVGDRISLGGVTGDVIDIGLVRLYLLELSGTGINLYPTGRVVVFSNSVLFQASPLFKQIPGTAYTWHEAVVPLAPGTDHAFAEKKLLDAVNEVYAGYRSDIEQQHGQTERTIDAAVPMPSPAGQIRFIDTGLEFVARYPVEIRKAPEIDDRVAAKLVEAISRDKDLAAVVSGPPKLRSVIKG
jgi:small-conductance mechanosensitive channel